MYLNGKIYGTTYFGGAYNSGTVFGVTLGGEERVLHAFDGYKLDGQEPFSGVVLQGGELYGTTRYGGSGSGGTIFRIKP